MNIHETYINRCLQLASLGAGNVAPNPMVGAVLVHEDVIIGEGYHMKFGEAHAEVNCINNVRIQNRHLIEKSTLYVSLEPCNHFGKTPPCTDLIMSHKIPRVVIACHDNYEKAAGQSIRKLQLAGIETIFGVLEKEALELNKRFFTFQNLQRPYIILKWAQSANRMIAGENSVRTKITNDITDTIVHKWRSEETAILVGFNTANQDNPSLTTRHVPGKSPVRIVIDTNLQLPAESNLLDNDVPTIIINAIKNEENGKTLFYKTSAEENMIAIIINLLHQRQLISLIVEGGAKLLQSFIDEGIWDEARIITNRELNIPGGLPAPVLKGEKLGQTENITTDEICIFRNSFINLQT